MTNYIIISHLYDELNQKSFENKLKETFPSYYQEYSNDISYLALPSRNKTGVEEKIKEVLNTLRLSHEEYVALYYSLPENPDEIQRAMILGSVLQIESDLQQLKPEEHVYTLSLLLNYNFLD